LSDFGAINIASKFGDDRKGLNYEVNEIFL